MPNIKVETFRQMERLMQEVPNFSRRKTGIFICTKNDNKGLRRQIEEGKLTYTDIMMETMRTVTYLPFLERLKLFLKGCEGKDMEFRNDRHKRVFAELVADMDQKNYRLMSAAYLLTADEKLWNKTRHYVVRNQVEFQEMKLKDNTNNGYALYSAAKDLYLGTSHLTIVDLADTKLIPHSIFGLICNGMAIRRFGLGAIQFGKEQTDD